MPDINFWGFIAGLGIFLLGINQMENGLKRLAGKTFRNSLKKHTKNAFVAILIGTVITAVLQSSSVVSLMVLAFVGAGIIPLRNAIAIIFGANLGTTVTGWIVATVGFQLQIDSFALPFLGIGGILLTFFSTRPFFSEIGRFLVGFGALFMGLEFMKTAIDVDGIDITFFAKSGIPAHLYFILGAILTAIIQSSSATMAITLSALYAGIIPLEVGGAIVIGGYLGTTVTVLLGAMKGSHVKKQMAFAHVGFNFITSIIALVLMYPLLSFVTDSLGIVDPLYQLVTFHSLFTLIGILVMLLFLSAYTRLLQRTVKAKKITLSPLLDTVPSEVPDGATEAIRKESLDLLERIKTYRFEIFNDTKKSFTAHVFDNTSNTISEQYANIKLKEGEIITYYLKIQKESMNKNEAAMLQDYIHAVKRLSLAAKNIKNVLHTITELKQESNQKVKSLQSDIQQQFATFYDALKNNFDEETCLTIIDEAYRKNVNQIYEMIKANVLQKESLTSYLHLNSQLKAYKNNFYEAWKHLNVSDQKE